MDKSKELDLHWMGDLYGVCVSDAENIVRIERILSAIRRNCFNDIGDAQITTILGNTGKPQNNGISGVINAPFGHFTIHTFSQRQVAFVDLFMENAAGKGKEVSDTLERYLSYSGGCDQRMEHEGEGFGEHVIIKTQYIPYRQAHRITTRMMEAIKMTRLNSRLDRRSEDGYDIVQPITESHIAIHAQREKDQALIDVFSCKPFKWHDATGVLYDHGIDQCSIEQISRGIHMQDKAL